MQDRLVKELRLRGISDIAGAQALVGEFMDIWNAKFARPPLDPASAHRPWTSAPEALDDEALARREARTLSKPLTFSAGGKVYCINTRGPGAALRGARCG